ncbi:hypothetical protein SEA_SIXAMA_7 [Gordonia phage Sixama]|uniref:Uncharacterized protein n=1 Tax=Gordonia phage Sixama TaxID=2653271 RepID=A0A5Q2F7R7_9CAUD|nr:hypothetical protein PP302_gp007 [Gordonia phage Sixama]QGF20186.1 hypothetical protein SEA_SIXAMA_7 [Gordonia phage Sixama]
MTSEQYDPAISASKRALDIMFSEGRVARSLSHIAEDATLIAAREALVPLRKIHRPIAVKRWGLGGPEVVCSSCLLTIAHGERFNDLWPCRSARFLYTDSEIEEHKKL